MKAFKRYLNIKGIDSPVYIDLSNNVHPYKEFLDILELALKVNADHFLKLYIHIILDWEPSHWNIRWEYTKEIPIRSINIGDNIFIENRLEHRLNTNNPSDLKDFYIGNTNILLLNLPGIQGIPDPLGYVKVIAKSRYWLLVHDPANQLSQYLESLAKKGLLPFSKYNQNVYQTLKTL